MNRDNRAYTRNSSIDFKGIAAAALASAKSLLPEWLPGGRFEGCEYVALNPTRNDRALGSFKINWQTGEWSDFADPNAKGGDLISLFAYINSLDQGQAARQVAEDLGMPAHHGAALPTRSKPDPTALIVHSFAGDDPITCKDYVREKAGLGAFKPNGPSAKPRSSTAPKGPRVVDATYDYKDESGTLLYSVIRYKPKDFRQCRPDGKGGQIWNLDDTRRVPYRLPELVQFSDATVFVCEGEKDANRVASLGHCATTVASGKWTDSCVQALAGRDIIVLQDNDEAGGKKALAAAQALHGVAKTIRIVLLPGLKPAGDVSDWLDADPERPGKLVDFCFDVQEWTPSDADDGDNDAPAPLSWLNMSRWDVEPVPERKWAIRDRVPLNQAGLFSGEGGTGKSIIELMKDVAHVVGKDWLGSLPEPGPAFYIGAEDDEDELHIRLAAVAAHYGATFEELTTNGLHVLCLLGQDATLCTVNGKSGRVEPTPLYRQLYEAAGDIKPKNISIDTLSRAFGGNEIDRVQVYAFANHMQALAKVAAGSVTVLSHPSLTGIASGSGISGSTAWHGAVRFRQYLKGAKQVGGEQPDGDLRELEFKKNQYGPTGETIVLRYQRGLFLPEHGMSVPEKAARETMVDDTLITIGKKLVARGQELSPAQTSHSYAVSLIANQPEAKGIKKAELANALSRLLDQGKLRIETLKAGTTREKKIIRF